MGWSVSDRGKGRNVSKVILPAAREKRVDAGKRKVKRIVVW